MKVEAVTFVSIEPAPIAVEGAAFDEAMAAVENESVAADEAKTDREAQEKEEPIDPTAVALFVLPPVPPAPAGSLAASPVPATTFDVLSAEIEHGGTEKTEREESKVSASEPRSPSLAPDSSSAWVGTSSPANAPDVATAKEAAHASRSLRALATFPQGEKKCPPLMKPKDAIDDAANPPDATGPQKTDEESLTLRAPNAFGRGERAERPHGIANAFGRTERAPEESADAPKILGHDDALRTAEAARVMTAIEPTVVVSVEVPAPAARIVNVPTVVNAPTAMRDADATVRTAESAAHKRVLTETKATGTLTLPELGRVDVEAHAATHERPIFVHVRADHVATVELLANHVPELELHVREAAPSANVAIERGFAQNDHEPREQRQREGQDVDDDARPAPRAFRRTARFVL